MSLININETENLFNEALSTELELISDPGAGVAEAFLENAAIETVSLPFDLLNGGLKAKSDDDKGKIQLKNNAELTIGGEASANLRFGIYDQQKDLETALEVTEEDMQVEIPRLADGEVYIIFVMSYELDAHADAGIPFSGGKVDIGLQSSKQRRQAVLRRFKKTDAIRTACVDTFASIRSVKDITGPQPANSENASSTELPDNTAILFNRAGSTGGSLGVSAGYDFNWAHTSKLNNLEGDLGLKAKLGATIGVGFGAAGSLTLMMNNLGDQKIRLQSFKQKDNNWNFSASLDASIQGELSDELKEKTVDDVLKAVLGTHYEQVFRELKKIEDALNPDELKDKIKGFSEELLEEITTGRLGTAYEVRRNELLDLIGKWEKLGTEAGAEVWTLLDKLVEDNTSVDLDKIRDEVKTLAAMNKEELKSRLAELFKDTGFLESDLGKLISTLVPTDDLVDALISDQLLNTVMEKLDDLHALLSIEDQVTKLHDVISEKLNIDKIKDALEQNSLENVSNWLIARVDETLDSKEVESVLKVFKEVQTFIDGIKGKASEFLEATKEAITKEYKAGLAYQFQKTSEKTALVDATFTFNADEDATVRTIFREVLEGEITAVLKKSIDEISLNRGVLTSKTSRKGSLSLTLPFMKRDFVHLNEAMVQNEFLQTEDGRLSMFTLKATDQRQRTHRMSEVTVDLIYHKLLNDQKDRVEKESWDMNYSFKVAREKFKKRDLEQVLKPFVALYLAESFEDQTNGLTVEQWIDGMEALVEEQSDDNDNKRRFGNVLLKLGLVIPSDAGRAWLKAPSDKQDPLYKDLAKALQMRLKALIPMYFLLDDRFYNSPAVREVLYAILIYKNLPYIEMIKKVKNNGKVKTNRWEITSELVPKVLRGAGFQARMKRDMTSLRKSLLANDDLKMRDFTVNIDESNLERVYQEFLSSNSSKVQDMVRDLFWMEEAMLQQLMEAGSEIGEFSQSTGSDSDVSVQEAVDTLDSFGRNIANAINNMAIPLIANNKDYTRYLGVDIFITVAKVFDPELDQKSKGLLQLTALNDDAEFDYESYLTGTDPADSDVLLTRLIHS